MGVGGKASNKRQHEKLSRKGVMFSLLLLNLCIHLKSLWRAFPPELIVYLGTIPATNNHRNMSPHYLTQQNNHSVVEPGPSMSGNSVTSLLWTKKSLQHRMKRFVGSLKRKTL